MKLSKRKLRFPEHVKDQQMYRSFHLPQREHPKQPMPEKKKA